MSNAIKCPQIYCQSKQLQQKGNGEVICQSCGHTFFESIMVVEEGFSQKQKFMRSTNFITERQKGKYDQSQIETAEHHMSSISPFLEKTSISNTLNKTNDINDIQNKLPLNRNQKAQQNIDFNNDQVQMNKQNNLSNSISNQQQIILQKNKIEIKAKNNTTNDITKDSLTKNNSNKVETIKQKVLQINTEIQQISPVSQKIIENNKIISSENNSINTKSKDEDTLIKKQETIIENIKQNIVDVKRNLQESSQIQNITNIEQNQLENNKNDQPINQGPQMIIEPSENTEENTPNQQSKFQFQMDTEKPQQQAEMGFSFIEKDLIEFKVKKTDEISFQSNSLPGVDKIVQKTQKPLSNEFEENNDQDQMLSNENDFQNIYKNKEEIEEIQIGPSIQQKLIFQFDEREIVNSQSKTMDIDFNFIFQTKPKIIQNGAEKIIVISPKQDKIQDQPIPKEEEPINNNPNPPQNPPYSFIQQSQSQEQIIINKNNPVKDKKALNSKGIQDNVPIFNQIGWPSLCLIGTKQSPIPIIVKNFGIHDVGGGIQVMFNQKAINPILLNDGNKLILKGEFGEITYQQQHFKTKELHFHHPSEHVFGNEQTRLDMEIQIINFSSSRNHQAAITIFLQRGADNAYNQFLYNLDKATASDQFIVAPGDEIQLTTELLLSQLVQNIDHYLTYEGSMTYPPCEQNVTWFLSRQQFSISKEQIENFQKRLGLQYNVRGLRDPGDRELKTF